MGADADRLRDVIVRIRGNEAQRRTLDAEMARLRQEQVQLLGRLSAPVPRPPARAGRASFEWRWEVVRDLLLWLGALLVGVAALIFAAVAWGRLGDGGRAALLLAATLAAGAATIATRRRLPATAEALGGLTAVLVLVDWYVVRRAGGGEGWSDAAWWALGTAVAAAASAGAASWLRAQAPVAGVLGLVSAVLTLSLVAGSAAGWGVGLALAAAVAAIAATLLLRTSRQVTAGVLALGAATFELGALVAAASPLPADTVGEAVGPALVLASMALAPGLAGATLRVSPSPALPDGLVTLAAAALIGSGGALLSGGWTAPGVFGPVAVLGAAALGLGRVLPAPIRRGAQVAGAATLAVTVAALVDDVVRAVFAPLSWAGDPWSGRLAAGAARSLTPDGAVVPGTSYGGALVMLLAVVGVAVVSRLRLPGPSLIRATHARLAAVAALVGLVAALPLAAGWPVWSAWAITATGAVAAAAAVAGADRQRRPTATVAVGGAAAVLAATATGWSFTSRGTTLAWLALLAATAAATAAVATTVGLRRGSAAVAAGAAIGEVAAVTAAWGAGPAPCGVALGLMAGILVVAGVHWPWRRDEGVVLEAVGLAGALLGAVLATSADPWLAVAWTVAVPWLALAGAHPARRPYLWAAAWASVAATWAWLAVADVTVVEAYTLPAAAMALGSGVVAHRMQPGLSSWTWLAPGLAVGLFPTLALGITETGVTRRLAVTAAGFAVVAAGARSQRQAPLVLGSLTLLLVALDAVFPVATELPRWLTIGVVGFLLLWIGATAERRVAQVRELRRRFDELEPNGLSPFLRRLHQGTGGRPRPA